MYHSAHETEIKRQSGELDRSMPASTNAPSDSEESPHSWPHQPANEQ